MNITKATAFLFYFVVATGMVLAQNNEEPETIIGNSSLQSTHYFFGVEAQAQLLSDKFRESVAPIFGLQGGIILNRKWIIGTGINGKVARSTYHGSYYDNKTQLNLTNQRMAVDYGYGSLFLAHVINSNKAVHYTLGGLFAVGSSNEYLIEADGDHGTTFNSPIFTLWEPRASVELNLTPTVRLAIGASYRFVNANKFESLTAADLSGLSFHTTLKVGKY